MTNEGKLHFLFLITSFLTTAEVVCPKVFIRVSGIRNWLCYFTDKTILCDPPFPPGADLSFPQLGRGESPTFWDDSGSSFFISVA